MIAMEILFAVFMFGWPDVHIYIMYLFYVHHLSLAVDAKEGVWVIQGMVSISHGFLKWIF